MRLAARGHQVDLYEQRDKLGGRAYVYEIDGFTLDAGPTLIAASWIFDEIWHATGRRRQGYFRLVPCDPLFRLSDHILRPFAFNADPERMPDLRANIVAEHRIDPRHFAHTLKSYLGSAFSFQPALMQSAWFRPHNRSEDIDNLYFVGASTHPGAGVPGVVSSANIIDSLIGDPATVRASSPTPSAASTRTGPAAHVDTPRAGG